MRREEDAQAMTQGHPRPNQHIQRVPKACSKGTTNCGAALPLKLVPILHIFRQHKNMEIVFIQ